jgi:hypothetical protein
VREGGYSGEVEVTPVRMTELRLHSTGKQPYSHLSPVPTTINNRRREVIKTVKAEAGKPKCPQCGQRDTQLFVRPADSSRYLYCNICQGITFDQQPVDDDDKPSYDSEMHQGGAHYNDVMFGDSGD